MCFYIISHSSPEIHPIAFHTRWFLTLNEAVPSVNPGGEVHTIWFIDHVFTLQMNVEVSMIINTWNWFCVCPKPSPTSVISTSPWAPIDDGETVDRSTPYLELECAFLTQQYQKVLIWYFPVPNCRGEGKGWSLVVFF